MPNLQSVGKKHGILASLVLITSFWIGGCQLPATPSEVMVGSDIRWKITGRAGPVSLRSPGRSFWQRAIAGVTIVPGSRIATFDGSRLELASAGDKLMASGPSRFTLPNAEQNGVRVRQDAGSLRYKVRSAPKRRFEVKTPHFSTVVKGTSFLVSIDRTSSTVLVDEGRVLVLDANGEPVAELTAGQTGRMAAHPGATLEMSTTADPTFQSAEPGAGSEAAAHSDAAVPQPTNGTGALSTASNQPGTPATEPSFFERVGSVVSDLAAQLSSGGAPTSGAVDLDNQEGGGARERERQSNAGKHFDGSDVSENGNGKAGRGGRDKGGKGKGKGKGKGESNDKGNGRSKGDNHGRGKGVGAGDAHMIFDRDDLSSLIAWSGRH